MTDGRTDSALGQLAGAAGPFAQQLDHPAAGRVGQRGQGAVERVGDRRRRGSRRSRPVRRHDRRPIAASASARVTSRTRWRERPHVALEVDRPVGAVAVELVFGLGSDGGPGRPGPLAVCVDVAGQVDVRVWVLAPPIEAGLRAQSAHSAPIMIRPRPSMAISTACWSPDRAELGSNSPGW